MTAGARTLELTCSATPDARFRDLTYGLNLRVTSDVKNNEIADFSELGAAANKFANVSYTPRLSEFVDENLRVYISSCGISLGRDVRNDYNLTVQVREFKYTVGVNGDRATVVLDYTLTNNDNETILRQTSRGRCTSKKCDPYNLLVELHF